MPTSLPMLMPIFPNDPGETTKSYLGTNTQVQKISLSIILGIFIGLLNSNRI